MLVSHVILTALIDIVYLNFAHITHIHTTLLKIKVLQKVLQVMPYKNNFCSTKNHSVKISFLTFFIIWRTFFHHKYNFVKQKDSSDVKVSLWNHLDKKVFLWHREAPLFLRVYRKYLVEQLQIKFKFKCSYYSDSTSFHNTPGQNIKKACLFLIAILFPSLVHKKVVS